MEFGATHFIESSKEDPVPIIKDLTGGGADYCFEAIGDPGAITQAYWALGVGSTLITVGVTLQQEMTTLPFFYNPLHCKTVKGTLYGNIDPIRDVPMMADMAVRGDFKLDRLIGRRFKIEEINEVVEAMKKREIIGRWLCSWE